MRRSKKLLKKSHKKQRTFRKRMKKGGWGDWQIDENGNRYDPDVNEYVVNPESKKFPDNIPLETEFLTFWSENPDININIPESIGNLTNLRHLRLSKLNARNLPNSIGNLTNLTMLNLSNNSLSRLPESIGNLTNLIDLNLEHNILFKLPESIGNLTNLIDLRLSDNQITRLPNSFSKLVKLSSRNVKSILQSIKIKQYDENKEDKRDISDDDDDNNMEVEEDLEFTDIFKKMKVGGKRRKRKTLKKTRKMYKKTLKK